MMRFRSRLLAAAGVALFGVTIALAQTPMPADVKSPGELTKNEEANAKLFKELSRKILELAVKLDKSDRPEDKDRAKTLRAALEVAEKAGVENQFRALLGGMKGSNKLQDLEKLIGQDEELSKTLLEMLNILNTDDETARLKAEIAMLEKFLKEAGELKRRQELLRTMTDTKKGDPKKISERQNDLAEQTKDLEGRMGGEKGDPKGPQPISKSDPKAADPKDGDKASDPKADTEGPKSESKDGDAKAGSDAKPMKGEPKDAPPREPKDGEAKLGEPKDTKPDPKKDDPAAPKDVGEGKSESKPSDGKPGEGKPMGKPPAGSPPQGESKSGGQSPPSGAQPPPPPPQNQVPGRKHVKEAYPHQKGAEEDADKNKRDDASKKMDKAVEELAKAIEEMKKRLKQLREEEMLKLLANLEARCNRMLAMQIEVYQNTKSIHDGIVKNDNQKTNADIQKSQQQSDREKEIVAEAEKTMKLLETEGSAVAFAQVLQEVMGDMQAVQLRLEKAVVGEDTQTIEQNIIAMLKDMVAALKKQQQEMQNSKNNPNPSQPSKPNQKLIDQLAELKLIKALQTQINSRTTMYGKKSTGEQAEDVLIQNELKQLAQRQTKLQDMIQKIHTQANQ